MVLLAMLASYLGIHNLDGVAGTAVSLIIMYSGYIIARDTMSPLMGERPSKNMIYRIEDLARRIPGVWGVHDVIVHHYGHTKLVSLHIEVDDREKAIDLHEISDRVEYFIEKETGAATVVHVDPLNVRHARYGEIYQTIRDTVAENDNISNFHELRIIGQGEKVIADFEITLSESADRRRKKSIIANLQKDLALRLTGVQARIKVDPLFVSNTPE